MPPGFAARGRHKIPGHTAKPDVPMMLHALAPDDKMDVPRLTCLHTRVKLQSGRSVCAGIITEETLQRGTIENASLLGSPHGSAPIDTCWTAPRCQVQVVRHRSVAENQRNSVRQCHHLAHLESCTSALNIASAVLPKQSQTC